MTIKCVEEQSVDQIGTGDVATSSIHDKLYVGRLMNRTAHVIGTLTCNWHRLLVRWNGDFNIPDKDAPF